MKTPILSTLFAGIAVCTLAFTQTAAAFDATATTAVNIRSGPGANYSKVDVLTSGEAVDITECKGNWCYVKHPGPDGWVSGKYLQANENAASGQSNNQQLNPALAAIFGAILGAVINEALDNNDPTPPAPPSSVLENGTYTIQQVSNGRYLDAHLVASDDFRVVTRNAQNNPTQLWVLNRKANGTYSIQQRSNMQYLDAHEGSHDNSIVTRPAQGNSTQEWRFKKLPNGNFTIRQRSNGRFMDAHEGVKDNDVVTRNAQSNKTQQWKIVRRTQPTPQGPPAPVLKTGTYTLQQVSNGRYLDAHLVASDDFRVVTRNAQNNASQLWALTRKSNGIYTVQQLSNMQYLDAHEGSHDNSIVTRPAQNNSTQEWRITKLPNGNFTIRQRSNGRFMDAHEGVKDNDVVTRNAQNNKTQQWKIVRR